MKQQDWNQFTLKWEKTNKISLTVPTNSVNEVKSYLNQHQFTLTCEGSENPLNVNMDYKLGNGGWLLTQLWDIVNQIIISFSSICPKTNKICINSNHTNSKYTEQSS